MINLELVKTTLADWSEPRPQGDWVVVPTSCTYPSNKTVHIYLQGGLESVRAYDGGGAFDELEGGGEYGFDAFKVLRRFAKNAGIVVDNRGWLSSDPVSYGDLPSLIPYLAKVSVEASEYLRGRRRKKKIMDLRDEVNIILRQRFEESVHRHGHLIGASTKSHKFDFIVETAAGRVLAIDAALPEASSINSIVVRHLDVRSAKPDGVSQIIVYDDRDEWKSENLSLLRTGGRPFAFSHLPEALSRLVAA